MTGLQRKLGWIASAVACTTMHSFAQACDLATWETMIGQAAKYHQVNAALIRAVIKVESDGCERLDDKPITSAAGAMGLMQLLPGTWRTYHDRLTLGENPYDPADNIMAGTAYLHDLTEALGLFDGLAAYFAGPTTIAKRRIDNSLPSTATLIYVHDVLEYVAQETSRPTARSPTVRPTLRDLFAIEHPRDQGATVSRSVPSRGLFAIDHSRRADEAEVVDGTESAK